ncbi:MAG: MurR/RpiR family transcriptional regulator [Sphaerochaetaceae bacterium]|nr:MurR/RpiR family transcriptional regulator [Sphaerochaetaceae bacterium]
MINNKTYLLEKLAQSKTPSEKKIAQYLLSNTKEVLNMTILELATKADTSTAAIIRFCKRLDLKGYPDLKIALAKEVFSIDESINNNVPTSFDFSKKTSVIEISDTILNITKIAVENLSKTINPDSLEKVVQKVKSCRSIQILGTGASGIVGKDLHQKFCRLGYLSIFNEDTELQTISACSATKEDVVFVISYSGEHKAIIKASNEAKKNNAFLIAITRFKKTDISKLADICLYVPDAESLYREGASLSRISQLLIVDILYQTLITSDYDHSNKLLKRTWESIDHKFPN